MNALEDVLWRNPGFSQRGEREVNQRIILVCRPRHFGGRQWYFICPIENKRASVLWMPPGAKEFRSRQAWDGKVAYRSQFRSVYDRAHAGKAKIKARLIDDLDPDDRELPPKPKWMRWRTYNRLAERFEAYDDMTYPGRFNALCARGQAGAAISIDGERIRLNSKCLG